MVYMVMHNVDDDDVGKEQRKAVGQCLLTDVSLMLLLQPMTDVMYLVNVVTHSTKAEYCS